MEETKESQQRPMKAMLEGAGALSWHGSETQSTNVLVKRSFILVGQATDLAGPGYLSDNIWLLV